MPLPESESTQADAGVIPTMNASLAIGKKLFDDTYRPCPVFKIELVFPIQLLHQHIRSLRENA
jgi:hypothetical protein